MFTQNEVEYTVRSLTRDMVIHFDIMTIPCNYSCIKLEKLSAVSTSAKV